MTIPRYLRSKRLRALLWYAAAGKCQICGTPLPDEWHADHITPWKVTQTTNLFHMQATCPACNLRKGTSMTLEDKAKRARDLCDELSMFRTVFRKPQAQTLDLLYGLAEGLSGGSWPYLTSKGYLTEEVVPGGGKSYMAVMASSVLVGSGLFDFAVWMTPRLNLQEQAREDFSNTGLGRTHFGKAVPIFNPARLQPTTLESAEQLFKQREVKVWVMSYQRLDSLYIALKHFVEASRVLLIFDEFQLLHEDDYEEGKPQEGWFKEIKPLTDACYDRTGLGGIILSGGLFRNDNQRLPLIGYRQGDISAGEDPKRHYPVADVTYTLSEAQADKAIIKIDFDLYKGEVEYRTSTEHPWEDTDDIQWEMLENMGDHFYNHKLKYFLKQEHVWKTIISNMLESLDYYNPPDQGYKASYMVISQGIDDAEQHAAYLHEIGRHPLLIHSKLTKTENKRLDLFRRGEGPWDGLVCIAMGYIGLSVKRLSHMAYLSHYRSVAWINQAFHRITRFDDHRNAPPYQYQLARIFSLNDPKMRRHVEYFMKNQNPGVLELPKPPGPPGPGGTPSIFTGHSATIGAREFNTNGVELTNHSYVEYMIKEIPELHAHTRAVVEKIQTANATYERLIHG